jgi:hypothetical protein
MRRFLDPFLVAVGTQIALILLALAYRSGAAPVVDVVEHIAFYAIGTLFVFGLLDLAGLARQLVRHGVLRAAEAAMDGQEADAVGRVRQFPDRRA